MKKLLKEYIDLKNIMQNNNSEYIIYQYIKDFSIDQINNKL
jgi:hypothetical protein